jgi:phosphoglycolate phosphatase-like HAD superfamily hydrolase
VADTERASGGSKDFSRCSYFFAMPRALIFDLDGTLVDTNAHHARAWQAAFARFGFRVGYDRVAIEIGKGGSLLMPSILGQSLTDAFGESLSAAHGEIYLDIVENEGVEVFPEVERVFAECRKRGVRTAIATGSKQRSLDRVAEVSGLDLAALADVLVVDDDVDDPKPHPDVVLAAVEKLELDPLSCAMIGDTVFDARASVRAGVSFAGVSTWCHSADELHAEGARIVFDDTAGLANDLDRLLAICLPEEGLLSGSTAERLVRHVIEESRAAMEQGEAPVIVLIADHAGKVLAQATAPHRGNFPPTARAAIRALDEAPAMHGAVLVTAFDPGPTVLAAALETGVDTVLVGERLSPDAFERLPKAGAGGRSLPRILTGLLPEEAAQLREDWNRNNRVAAAVH